VRLFLFSSPYKALYCVVSSTDDEGALLLVPGH
jgi:hypothetical protein